MFVRKKLHHIRIYDESVHNPYCKSMDVSMRLEALFVIFIEQRSDRQTITCPPPLGLQTVEQSRSRPK